MSYAKEQFEAQFEYGQEVDYDGGASVPQGEPPIQRKPRITNVIAIAISVITTAFCLAVVAVFPWPASVAGMIGATINGALLIVNLWRYRHTERVGLH